MRILGWNCQDICNALIVRALEAQIKGARPDLIFLSETRATNARMNSVKSSLKFDNKIVMEAKGSAGGLCMMWKNGLTIKSVEYNKNIIAIKISEAVCDWLLVGFYGPPYHSKKKKAWEGMCRIDIFSTSKS